MDTSYLTRLKPVAAKCRIAAANWLRRHWPGMRKRLRLWGELIRFDRPIGTLLLLWPTLWALWIAAAGPPTIHLLLVFVLGVFLTRSAGCIANDLADRAYDPYVERTRARPLASGQISRLEAVGVALVLLGVALLLVLTTNRLTVLLSLAAVPIAIIYPFMKRYTYVPQFFLGIAFSWGIPMAFAAETGSVPRIAWLLLTANLLWVVVYDTIYAMVDREDDIRLGVKSTAILFADADRVIIGIIQVMFLSALLLIGHQLAFGNAYYSSVVVAAGFIVYHQYLIRDRLREHCFRAFLNNNWVGFVIFAGIALQYR